MPEAKPDLVPENGEAEAGSLSKEIDFSGWLGAQAAALRSRSISGVDWDGIAEELEAMAKREERELIGHLKNLLVHLLKWGWQPQRRSSSWENPIDESREQIGDVLADSPSFKTESRMRRFVESAYGRARRRAGTDMKLQKKEREGLFPATCPWTFDEFMGEDFLPRSRKASNGHS